MLIFLEDEPHIKQGPQDQTIQKIGENVVLTCEATKPFKTIRWFKNGKKVWPRSDKIIITTHGPISTLEIANFDERDEGEYYAHLERDERSVSAVLQLKVKPELLLPKTLEKKITTNVGADLDFKLNFTGHPVPEIEVTLNDEPLQKNKALIVNYENTISIRLHSLERQDSGILKIIAKNNSGFDQKEIHISVADIPSQPRNLNASKISENSVLLNWDHPANVNGSAVLEYIVERKMAEAGRWRNLAKIKASETRFVANELLADSIYAFRIFAVNSIGKSPPSNEIDVIINTMEILELSEKKNVSRDIVKAPEVKITSERGILIIWPEVSGAKSYRIERMSKHKLSWQCIDIINTTSYEDRSVEFDTIYLFRVITIFNNEFSPPSEPSDEISVPRPVEAKEDEGLSDRKTKKMEEIELENGELEKYLSKTVVSLDQMLEIASNQTEEKSRRKAKKDAKKGKKTKEIVVSKDYITEFTEFDNNERPPKSIKQKQEKKTIVSKKEKKSEQLEEILQDANELQISIQDENLIESKVEKKKNVVQKAKSSGEQFNQADYSKKLEQKVNEGKETRKKVSKEKISGKMAENGTYEANGDYIEEIQPIKEKQDKTRKHHKTEVLVLGEQPTVKKQGVIDKEEDQKVAKDKSNVDDMDSEIKGSDAATDADKAEIVAEKIAEKKSEKTKVSVKKEEEESKNEITDKAISEKSRKATQFLKVTAENTEKILYFNTKAELLANIEGDFERCLWTHNGQLLDEKDIKTSTTTSVLHLNKINEATSGKYICSVENALSKSSVDFHVSVIG